MLTIDKLRAFLSYVVIEGALLYSLFYAVTLVLAIGQQYAGVRQLMGRLRNTKLGIGNVYAAVVGAPVPFCACSTIPVLSGMLRMNIRFGICITFLMASPLVNEAVVIVMVRYFGLKRTALYVLMGIVFPIIAGIALDLLGMGRFVKSNIEEEIPGEVIHSDVLKTDIPWRARLRFANIVAITEVRSIFYYLLIGLFIGGLIHGFVPPDWVVDITNRVPPALLVPMMAIVGAPMSFNLAAVVPVAFALVEKHLAFGPILAFLVSGGALSIPEFFLLSKLFRPVLMIIYAASVILVAIAMGYFFTWVH